MSSLRFPVQKPFRVRTFLLCSVAFILVLSPAHPDSALAQASVRMARKVLTQVSPEYPDFFRNGHFEGRIVAEATVLANGSVSSVEIKAGNPMFATFASKALMKWKYAPGPDKTVEEVIFNFNSTPR
jgi:outer membrane biosynthesis protein TonB